MYILREARKRGVRESQVAPPTTLLYDMLLSIRGLAFQIVFSDVAPRDEHLRRGVLADLFLDTGAQNSHTTACDIL